LIFSTENKNGLQNYENIEFQPYFAAAEGKIKK